MWTEVLNPTHPWFAWVIVPVLIFLARICDVSLGTIRIIFITRGLRYLAPLVGFFEVLIWLLAVTQIMRHLDNAGYYLVYAGGFAAGNFVGMYIEHRLAMGMSMIRIILAGDPAGLLEAWKQAGYDATHHPGQGLFGPVSIVFSIVPRKDIRKAITLIRQHCPSAVYTVEDVRFVSPGIFRSRRPHRFIDAAANSLDCT
jgi:uncharacterized protein YebE (UPF0316 family)